MGILDEVLIERTLTRAEAVAQFAELCDAAATGEVVHLTGADERDEVVLISAREWSIMRECLHLLGSRPNAERLWDALAGAGGEGEHVAPEDLPAWLEQWRREAVNAGA
ncbi:MAG: type II toxin-antitoxin system Phd/YefM family antitoxin [Dehalococcoidia bacterium]